jgi:hypothetical protein
MSSRSALLIDGFLAAIPILMRLSLKKYKLFLQKNQLFSTHIESHPPLIRVKDNRKSSMTSYQKTLSGKIDAFVFGVTGGKHSMESFGFCESVRQGKTCPHITHPLTKGAGVAELLDWYPKEGKVKRAFHH